MFDKQSVANVDRRVGATVRAVYDTTYDALLTTRGTKYEDFCHVKS